jgi:hypothetical protein
MFCCLKVHVGFAALYRGNRLQGLTNGAEMRRDENCSVYP